MAEWKDRYNFGNDWVNHQVTVVNMIPVMSNRLKEEQLKDEYCSDIIKSLKNEDQTNDIKKKLYKKRFVIVIEILYKLPDSNHINPRLVLTPTLLQQVLHDYHSSTVGDHFGIEKTYLKVITKCWKPNLYEDIKKICETCQVCLMNKLPKNFTVIPGLKPIPRNPMDKLELNFQGPYKKSLNDNTHIIVATEYLTLYVFAKPLSNSKATAIIKFLKRIFLEPGIPLIIQTDQGRNFLSDELSQFFNENGIYHSISTPYHPQSQGLVERSNQVINERIRLFCKNIKQWDKQLQELVYSINTIIKSQLNSLFRLLKGYSLREAIDNHFKLLENEFDLKAERELARERIEESQNKYYLSNSGSNNPFDFKEGLFVLVEKMNITADAGKKLTKKLLVPFLIIRIQEAPVTLFH